MELFYRKMGSGSPFIILHGLYGMSDNWYSIGKYLSAKYTVYIVDQRNHGQSPHSEDHNYELMKQDLLEFLDRHGLEKSIIMGHSMGGKTAAFFALDFPERVEKLIVVDMVPKKYTVEEYARHNIDHRNIISTLLSLNIHDATTRTEIEKSLEPSIPGIHIRQFLLKNLKRDKDKNFYWALNLMAIAKDIRTLLDGIEESMFQEYTQPCLPALFIRGAKSDYILPEDKAIIQTLFPLAAITTIEDAGHWVHAEQQERFMEVLFDYLNDE